MSVLESFVVTLFSMSIVFFVLASLWALIKILSTVLKHFENRKSENTAAQVATGMQAAVAAASEIGSVASISAGQVKLIDVDEKTAAMIMAIVSHESQIPLSELSFKSIKAL